MASTGQAHEDSASAGPSRLLTVAHLAALGALVFFVVRDPAFALGGASGLVLLGVLLHAAGIAAGALLPSAHPAAVGLQVGAVVTLLVAMAWRGFSPPAILLAAGAVAGVAWLALRQYRRITRGDPDRAG